MNTIWKYQLEITDVQVIRAPGYAKPLSIGFDPQGVLCVWMKVDPEGEDSDFQFHIVGTGREIPALPLDFIGSVTMTPFVWHVFLFNPPF